MGKVSRLGYVLFPSLAEHRDILVALREAAIKTRNEAISRADEAERLLHEAKNELQAYVLENERLKTENAALKEPKPIEGKVLRPKTAGDVRRIFEEANRQEDSDGV